MLRLYQTERQAGGLAWPVSPSGQGAADGAQGQWLAPLLAEAPAGVAVSGTLAVQQWQPKRILEGQDDGHEPDFTLWLQGQVIGVELTTLPRLRDQMGNHQPRSRRLYW